MLQKYVIRIWNLPTADSSAWSLVRCDRVWLDVAVAKVVAERVDENSHSPDPHGDHQSFRIDAPAAAKADTLRPGVGAELFRGAERCRGAARR